MALEHCRSRARSCVRGQSVNSEERQTGPLLRALSQVVQIGKQLARWHAPVGRFDGDPRMRTSKWICLVGGALLGAGLWPFFAWLVVAIDDGTINAPPRSIEILAPVWIILGMPGVILENRGYLTLGFLMLFWAAVGAAIARVCYYGYECLLSMLSMRNEKPFADRGDDSGGD
jgi:hypothetical protein